MKKILLPVPPLHEQRHIADFLDEKCAEIDRAVSAAERSVQEYVVYKRGSLPEPFGVRVERGAPSSLVLKGI